MKCFYHEEKDAVATCKICNKSLCRICYEIANNGKCEECNNSSIAKDNQKKESLRKNKFEENLKEILKSALIFAAGFIFMMLLYVGKIKESGVLFVIWQSMIFGYVVFSGYIGERILSYIKREKINILPFSVIMPLKTVFIITIIMYGLKLFIYISIGIFFSIPYILFLGYNCYKNKTN